MKGKCDRINESRKQELDSFAYEIIKHYFADIINICALMEDEINKNNQNYIIKPKKDFEELRFGDVLLKLNSALFAEDLKNRIKRDERELRTASFGLPKLEASFNNKSSTITIVYKEPTVCGTEVDDDDWDIKHEKGIIGVQIQGNQFRIYCGPSSGDSTYKDENMLYNEFTCLGWFENYISNKIRNKNTNMRDKGYCVYKKGYLHMYQYWKIAENNTSHDFIYSEIKQELIRTKNLIDGGHVHF